MTDTKAKVVGINGKMVTIEFQGSVSMNEVGYVNVDGKKLRGEVIRIRGNKAQMQIFEMTQGIKAGDKVDLVGDLLCAELGPGLLGQTFDEKKIIRAGYTFEQSFKENARKAPFSVQKGGR